MKKSSKIILGVIIGVASLISLLVIIGIVIIGYAFYDAYKGISDEELGMITIEQITDSPKVNEPCLLYFNDGGVEGIFDIDWGFSNIELSEDTNKQLIPGQRLLDRYSEEEINEFFVNTPYPIELKEGEEFIYAINNYAVLMPEEPGEYELDVMVFYKSTSPSFSVTKKITVND